MLGSPSLEYGGGRHEWVSHALHADLCAHAPVVCTCILVFTHPSWACASSGLAAYVYVYTHMFVRGPRACPFANVSGHLTTLWVRAGCREGGGRDGAWDLLRVGLVQSFAYVVSGAYVRGYRLRVLEGQRAPLRALGLVRRQCGRRA
jgi:hypothetical protein